LSAATAELTKLAGWMAHDLDRHGLGQRYLIQSLRLAQAAGDEALGAEILNGMSHHATYLGHGAAGVDLASARCDTRPQPSSPSAGAAARDGPPDNGRSSHRKTARRYRTDVQEAVGRS
jgi:hypothetical protein